jgi:hypothetical protein
LKSPSFYNFGRVRTKINCAARRTARPKIREKAAKTKCRGRGRRNFFADPVTRYASHADPARKHKNDENFRISRRRNRERPVKPWKFPDRNTISARAVNEDEKMQKSAKMILFMNIYSLSEKCLEINSIFF